jgi:hypothetical protein
MMRAFDSFLDHFLKVELPKLEVCAAGASVTLLSLSGQRYALNSSDRHGPYRSIWVQRFIITMSHRLMPLAVR